MVDTKSEKKQEQVSMKKFVVREVEKVTAPALYGWWC